jgi:hypothetical protein
MNKIKEINIVFMYHGYRYKCVESPFLDKIHSQCTSKHIEIIDKFWFKHWLFETLYDLCSRLVFFSI